MTNQWEVTVELDRSDNEKSALSSDEQRALLRQLASLDPRPVDCTFVDSYAIVRYPDKYIVAKILFVTESPTRFEAQTHADAVIKKLEEVLAALKLRVHLFSVDVTSN